MKILLGGAGALGSQLALMLSDSGREFVVIDDDRVEVTNLSTTVYSSQHVGALKAVALCELLYRKAGCRGMPLPNTLDVHNLDVALMTAPDLVIDTFDNVQARGLLCRLDVPTVHVGVAENRTGMVYWDQVYRLPEGAPRGEDHICTHQLGRRILRFTAAVAAGIIENYMGGYDDQRSVITTEFLDIIL